MSESPIRSRSQARSVAPTTITPQLVTDPTILDSVAGFINEVVPTTHTVPYDTKDQIQWARFEQLESDEDSLLPIYECDQIIPDPIILILGYTTGIQVWAILANGEATEILSWRHSTVKVTKILPNPVTIGNPKRIDTFKVQRPLIAVCDSSSTSPQFSACNFISLRTGEQVKTVKFKNSILDVLANKQSIIFTFQEKIAVFDAFTMEDRLIVTTCYLSPGLQPNPVALGARWLAYAEKKLNPSKRSNGGNDGEGVQSYTATVLHAAKSLGRGLRELGESVASSLSRNPSYKPGTSPNSPQAGGQFDIPHKGVVTILDIEGSNAQAPDKPSSPGMDPIIAHFPAHTEAIVSLKFDPSGMLLLTADKRGHDFHLFRIHSHPAGPALAAVHHLYVLHRGDTTAKVQDICFSPDSRWVAVSTLRGTSHVFPVTPYGGNVGVRTHATPHVVNKMSRFHRSAGLTVDGRSNSPVSMEMPTNSNLPYHNPRLPPYPHPTVVHPLAQIRQPLFVQNQNAIQQRSMGLQRLSSSSEETISLQVVCCFAPPRAWIDNTPRDTPVKQQVKPVESLFIMSCHGMLIQYDLEPHQASNIPKEKVCGETPIELTVTAKAQWLIERVPGSSDLGPPMASNFLRYFYQDQVRKKNNKTDDDQWLSQVEILTHAGPHRRLWMGPQFSFKTYTTISGSPNAMAEAQPLDLRGSKPVNMPITKANAVFIESGSASSFEHAVMENYDKVYQERGVAGELQLKEDLADAMLESPRISENSGRCVIVQMKPATVAKVVNPLGTVVNVQSDDDSDMEVSEDSVIHENCDEALFRPIVTPQPRICHEINRRYADNILTKSIEASTEVAVKILKKTPKPRSRESSPKKPKESPVCKVEGAFIPKVDGSPRVTAASTKIKSKIRTDSKAKLDVSSTGVTKLQPTLRSKKTAEKLLTDPSFKTDLTEVPELRELTPEISAEAPTPACHHTVELIEISESTAKSSKPTEIPLPKSLSTIDLIKMPESKTNKSAEILIPQPLDIKGVMQSQPGSRPVGLPKSQHISKHKKAGVTMPPACKINLAEMPKLRPTAKPTKAVEKPQHLDTIDVDINSSINIINFDLPILDNEDFFSLETLPKAEKFEDARDCESSTNKDDKSGNVRTDIDDSSNDSWEDRSINKRNKKPKTKLGVRIASLNIDNINTSKKMEWYSETTPPTLSKKSWSSIAASKPIQDKSSNDNVEKEKPVNLDVPELEYEEFVKKHETIIKVDDLIDIHTPKEEKTLKNESNNDAPEISSEEDNLMKIDKSSDDEKGESSSSPAEATESDDSGKVPEAAVFEDMVTSQVTTVTTAKASRRKRKKK